jgi:O-antigen/teichoic acid export membrane protein
VDKSGKDDRSLSRQSYQPERMRVRVSDGSDAPQADIAALALAKPVVMTSGEDGAQVDTAASRGAVASFDASSSDIAAVGSTGSFRQFTGAMRAVGNSTALFLAQLIAKLSTFVAFYIVSLTLPVREFGLYTLVLALRELTSAVASFGLDDILVRMLSQAQGIIAQKRLLRDAVIIKCASGALACGIMIAVATLLQVDDDLAFGAALAGCDLILIGVTASLASYYRARLRASALTGIQAAVSLLYLGLLGLGAWRGSSWLDLLLALVVSDAILCVAIAFKLSGRLGPAPLDAAPRKRVLFIGALPLGLASIAVLAYTRLDTVLIAYLRTPTEVALYTVSYKLTEVPLILMTAIAASALPVVSAWSVASIGSARVIEASSRALRYSAVLALPIAVGVTFFARDLLSLLYGQEFAGAAPAVSVLIWAMVAMSSNIVSGAILTAIRKAHLLAIIAAINLVVNITVNLWAIPRWGYFGAAVATATTEGLNAAMQVTLLCLVLRRLRLATGYALSLILSVATLSVSFGLVGQLTQTQELAALCLVPILLVACRLLTLDDLRALSRVVKQAGRRYWAMAEGRRTVPPAMET